MAALAPVLPDQQRHRALSDALAAATSITNPDARVRALAALAPVLPDEQRHRALSEALAATTSIANLDVNTWALTAISNLLARTADVSARTPA